MVDLSPAVHVRVLYLVLVHARVQYLAMSCVAVAYVCLRVLTGRLPVVVLSCAVLCTCTWHSATAICVLVCACCTERYSLVLDDFGAVVEEKEGGCAVHVPAATQNLTSLTVKPAATQTHR